jgi:hypothetical protein
VIKRNAKNGQKVATQLNCPEIILELEINSEDISGEK